MNFQIFGLFVILGCGSISNHVSAQSVSFTSSFLSRNRNYTCSGDVGTFLCSGVGDDLIFYAPPLVNLSSPIRYFRSDRPGDGAVVEPFVSTLISTGSKMVAVLFVEANASVQEITVRCIVNSTSEGEAFYRREGILRDVSSPSVRQLFDDEPNDFDTGSVEVSWARTSGEFDISDFTVELFVDNMNYSRINVSPDVSSAQFSAPIGSSVYARVIVNSACGSSTAGIMTDPRGLSISRSPSINAAIAFFVILAIAVLGLGIAVGVLSGLLCCKTK